VLLSAVLGGRAKAILEHRDLEEIVTTEATFEEVREYASQLARKKRLPLDLVLLAVATLPARVVARESTLPRSPGQRSGSPSETPMMPISWRLPCTSKSPSGQTDNDFEDAGVEWYTTGQLLKKLNFE
jgi:hypothetical protein